MNRLLVIPAVCTAVLLLSSCRSADADGAAGELASLDLGTTATCEFRPLASSHDAVQLTDVQAIDVDGQGNIYVADPLKGAVVVLAADGRPLRDIGRKGEGPGEFDYIRNVQVLPGDSLLVFDHGLHRTTVFAQGSDKAAYLVDHAAQGLVPPNWVERVPGSPLLFATFRDALTAGANGSKDPDLKQAVRLLDAQGRLVRDSVLVTPASNEMLIARQGGSVAVTKNPFGRPSLFRVGDDGRIYYARGDSLAIGIYSTEGQRVGGFSVRHTAPRVTDSDLSAAVEPHQGSQMIMNAMRQQAPERWPALRNFVLDERGLIWVGVLTPANEPTRWVAFDTAGKAVCSTSLPRSVDLKRIRGGNAYGVQVDELDVPRIVVYSIAYSN